MTLTIGYRGIEHLLETSDEEIAARAQAIYDASDDEGIIQAEDMLVLFPSRPESHTTTRLYTALLAAGMIESGTRGV